MGKSVPAVCRRPQPGLRHLNAIKKRNINVITGFGLCQFADCNYELTEL